MKPITSVIATIISGFLFFVIGAYVLFGWAATAPTSLRDDAVSSPDNFATWFLGGNESGGMLGGDWGISMASDRPVNMLLNERLPSSLELLGVVTVVSVVWGTLLGVAMAYLRMGHQVDGILRPMIVAILAIPILCFALLGIYHLAFEARLLPIGGRCEVSLSAGCPSMFERLEYLIIPVSSLAFVFGNAFALWIRQAILRMCASNDMYKTGSKAFGIGIIWGILHGLPYLFVSVMSSLVIVETIFSWPGIGRIMISGLVQYDMSVVIGALYIILMMTVQLYVVCRIINIVLIYLSHLQAPEFTITPFFLIGIPANQTSTASPQSDSSHHAFFKYVRLIGIAIAFLLFAGVAGISLTTNTNNALEQNLNDRLLAPNEDYPMGTDQLGRDLQSIMNRATSISIRISSITAIGATLFGGVFGLILAQLPGMIGERINLVVNMILDAIFLYPLLLFVLVAAAVTNPSLSDILSGFIRLMVPVSLVIVRGATWEYHTMAGKRKQKPDADDIEISESSPKPSLALHLATAGLFSIVIVMILTLTFEMLGSFLGVLIQPPEFSLGSSLSSAMQTLRQAPYLVTLPAQQIIGIMIALWVVGEYLRSRLRLDS